jgi:hypothetical protein
MNFLFGRFFVRAAVQAAYEAERGERRNVRNRAEGEVG